VRAKKLARAAGCLIDPLTQAAFLAIRFARRLAIMRACACARSPWCDRCFRAMDDDFAGTAGEK